MLKQSCFNCSQLMGCPFLADKKGIFNGANVVNGGNPIECADWAPIDQRQKDVRDVLYGIQGEGCLRVLHQVPSMIMEQLTEEERAGEMNLGDMPDLAGMLQKGMTTTEREEQLRYETDEDGNLVYDESGDELVKRPRPSYQLRKFACDLEGHIQLDHSVGMFWTTDQVVRHILATEVEQGSITKVKKTKAAKTEQQTETNMAKEGRRVLINRGGSKGPKVGASRGAPAEGKVGKPPARKGAAAKNTPAEAPAGGNGGTDPAFDAQSLIQDMQVAIGETVARAVNEAKNELFARIEAAESRALDATTILHDMLVQTGGTMQYEDEDGEVQSLPEQFTAKNRILSYLDDPDPS